MIHNEVWLIVIHFPALLIATLFILGEGLEGIALVAVILALSILAVGPIFLIVVSELLESCIALMWLSRGRPKAAVKLLKVYKIRLSEAEKT